MGIQVWKAQQNPTLTIEAETENKSCGSHQSRSLTMAFIYSFKFFRYVIFFFWCTEEMTLLKKNLACNVHFQHQNDQYYEEI